MERCTVRWDRINKNNDLYPGRVYGWQSAFADIVFFWFYLCESEQCFRITAPLLLMRNLESGVCQGHIASKQQSQDSNRVSSDCSIRLSWSPGLQPYDSWFDQGPGFKRVSSPVFPPFCFNLCRSSHYFWQFFFVLTLPFSSLSLLR